METEGTFEAKTHLSELLDRVDKEGDHDYEAWHPYCDAAVRDVALLQGLLGVRATQAYLRSVKVCGTRGSGAVVRIHESRSF
jgi:hypothetical protein